MQLKQALFLLPVFYGFPTLNNLMILIICGGGKQCWPELLVTAGGCGLRKHVMKYLVPTRELREYQMLRLKKGVIQYLSGQDFDCFDPKMLSL